MATISLAPSVSVARDVARPPATADLRVQFVCACEGGTHNVSVVVAAESSDADPPVVDEPSNNTAVEDATDGSVAATTGVVNGTAAADARSWMRPDAPINYGR